MVRSRRWRDVAVVAVPAVLLLAVWFGWSFKTYGRKATLASNTSVTSAAPGGARNTVKILRNISDTIIPAWARNAVPKYDQKNAAGKLRDQAFTFYQMNLIFAMGAIGGPLVLWLVYLWLIRAAATPERTFWRILVPFCIVVGIAVVGERDPLGVPHLTLLALEVAGITLLAAAFPKLGRAFRLAIVMGCCIDFSLGVYLQAHVEGMENSPFAMVYPELSFRGRDFLTVGSTPESLGENPWHNWWIKRRGELSERWLAELPRGHQGDRLFAASWPQVQGILKDASHDDEVNWGVGGRGTEDVRSFWATGRGPVGRRLGYSIRSVSADVRRMRGAAAARNDGHRASGQGGPDDAGCQTRGRPPCASLIVPLRAKPNGGRVPGANMARSPSLARPAGLLSADVRRMRGAAVARNDGHGASGQGGPDDAAVRRAAARRARR